MFVCLHVCVYRHAWHNSSPAAIHSLSKVPAVPMDKLNQLLSLVSSLRTAEDQMVRLYVYESTLCTVYVCVCCHRLLDIKCVYNICTYKYIRIHVHTYRM